MDIERPSTESLDLENRSTLRDLPAEYGSGKRSMQGFAAGRTMGFGCESIEHCSGGLTHWLRSIDVSGA